MANRRSDRLIDDAAEHERRRQAQLQALERAAGAWKRGGHPDLERGAARWVEKLREEAETRFRRVAKRNSE
jgi:hypothetical protein